MHSPKSHMFLRRLALPSRSISPEKPKKTVSFLCIAPFSRIELLSDLPRPSSRPGRHLNHRRGLESRRIALITLTPLRASLRLPVPLISWRPLSDPSTRYVLYRRRGLRDLSTPFVPSHYISPVLSLHIRFREDLADARLSSTWGGPAVTT